MLLLAAITVFGWVMTFRNRRRNDTFLGPAVLIMSLITLTLVAVAMHGLGMLPSH